MKLENQVTSLELSKRLKELGVKQESLFYWYESSYSGAYLISSEKEMEHIYVRQLNDETITYSKEYSAYTVAELVSLLQTVAKQDIIVALDDTKVADTLAKQLINHYAQESKDNR